MENEINKLKSEYQAITPPENLFTDGVNDLWIRIDDASKPVSRIFFAQIIMVVLIFFAMTGMLGIKFAQAKEGSAFYPVKAFAKKTIKNISNKTGIKFNKYEPIQLKSDENEIINNSTLSPTSSPMPTVKSILKIKNTEDEELDSEEENNEKLEKNENKSDQKEVKGASTVSPNNNSSQSSENSQRENNLNKTEDHPSENSNSSQNKFKESENSNASENKGKNQN